MVKFIFGDDQAMSHWAGSRIPHVGDAGFGPCIAIGVASDEPEEKMYAVCVFHDYQPQLGTVQVSMAAENPHWATQGVLRGLLHYPFHQLGVRKLWMAIPSNNTRALKFNKGIGMVQEAILRQHFGPRRHAIILSMMDTEYRRSRWAWKPPAVVH